MKKILFLICTLLLCWGLEAQESSMAEQTTIAKLGTPAPSFVATMLDGTTVESESLKGKVVLLNFWATWCPPCRQEFMRVQEDIVDRYAGRDFVYLLLSRREEKKTVEKFMAKNGYTFTVGIDHDNSVYSLFASNYIPRNFVIDKAGDIAWASVGYKPDEFEAMLKVIDRLLE